MNFKKLRYSLLIAYVSCGTMLVSYPKISSAEDCTGTLPGADCTLDEDTTADLTIDNGITLSIGTSVTVGDNVDGSTLPGDGTISTFGGGTSVTQTGDIGSTTVIDELLINDDNTWTTSGAINTDNSGADINLGAADGGETLNFIDGGSFSGEIDGHNGDIVNFGSDGNGGTFITGGQIETVTLIITSGTIDINNTLGGGAALNSFSVADGAVANMNTNTTTSGALDNDGRIVIGSESTLSADTYVADADAGTFVIEVARNTGTTEVGGLDVASGGALDLSNDTLQIAVDSSSAVLVNETISNFIVGNTAAIIGPNQFIDDSFLYDFQLQANGNDYDLVITVSSLENVTTTLNNQQVANILLSKLAGVDNSDLNNIQSLLGSDSSSDAFNERLESLQPTVDGGYVAASLVISSKVKNFTHGRVKTLFHNSRKLSSRSGNASSTKKLTSGSKKLVSGGKDLRTGRRIKKKIKGRKIYTSERKGSLWAQPFVSGSTQNKKDNIDGFETSSSGIVIGVDSGNIHEDMIFGVALTKANTDIDSNNANRTTTDVSSYGIDLFGGVAVMPHTIIDASASYIHNNNDYVRKDVAGIVGNNAKADYVAEHFSLHSRLSHRYKTVGNLSVTPSVTLNYDNITAAKYEENGISSVSLEVDQDSINKLGTGIGVDLDWEHETEGGAVIRSDVYANYSYDFINDGVSAVSNFSSSPSNTFVTKGFEPQKSQLNLGAGVDLQMTDNLKLTAGYDFEYKDQYDAHTGHVSLVRDFY